MSAIKKKRERESKYLSVTAMKIGSGKCNTTTSDFELRSVQFSHDAIVHEIPSYQDLEAYEWSLLWYAPEDYKYFNDQCESSARKLENDGIRCHSKRHLPLYGLENWTKDGFRKSIRNRKDAVHVVLEEQFAQWGDGVNDTDSIAELYSARCKHIEMVALTRGLMLEREVQKLQAKAMLESPRVFSNLRLSQLSPYIEKMKLLTRQQFSQNGYSACKKWTHLANPKDRSTLNVDCKKTHPPTNNPFSSPIRVVPPFSPRPTSQTKTKKRKS